LYAFVRSNIDVSLEARIEKSIFSLIDL